MSFEFWRQYGGMRSPVHETRDHGQRAVPLRRQPATFEDQIRTGLFGGGETRGHRERFEPGEILHDGHIPR